MPDKDEVPGSSPGRPTSYRRRSERCRQRAGRARCRLGPRWGRTPIPVGTSPGPSGAAHPGVSLGDDHPPWSRSQPRTPPTRAGAATLCCSLHPRPPRRRPPRALPTPAWPAWSLSGPARPPRPAPNPAARDRHRPPSDHRDLGSVARVPAFATVVEPSTARQPPGPPPVPVVRVARPARPGSPPPPSEWEDPDASGRMRQTPDGWTPDGWTADGWTADGRPPDPLDDDPR
jgi:hypothetical protein